MKPLSAAALVALVVAGCAHPPPTVSPHHLQRQATSSPEAPPPLASGRQLPPPRPRPPQETFSVDVQNVPLRELLFALARDAKVDLDLHPDVNGFVTLHAIDQTLPQILARVAKQVELRFTLQDRVLTVVPDRPYLHLYRIDYPNMQRDVTSQVAIATQVAATGNAGGSAAGNDSRTQIANTTHNRFWTTLVESVQSLLRETDKLLPAEAQTAPASGGEPPAAAGKATPAAASAQAPGRSTYREAASVIAHPETGTLAVRATARQHERVQEFIDRVLGAARRQVLIEATVVEVELSDDYQQGIRWDLLRNKTSSFRLTQAPAGTAEPLPGGTPASGQVPALGVLSFSRTIGSVSVDLAIQLLESFGRTRVLSSPKISVLNNQTAVIKVVENLVYFTLSANYTPGTASAGATFTVSSTPNTVPVGFLMNVMPQIGEDDEIVLNLRPTISRLAGYVEDPGVALTLALARQGGANIPDVRSRIPQIQTREMESIIRVRDGEFAVLGGLMRDSLERGTDAVPGVADLPGVGELFRYRNSRAAKSELVVFLRPTVVRDASIAGDYRSLAAALPDGRFFRDRDAPVGSEGKEGLR